jgi:hypothetical protein
MTARTKKQHDPVALKKRLMADPATIEIAKTIKTPLAEYVDQVVHFMMNPQADAQVTVLTDAELKEKGLTAPDNDAMGKYLIEAVAVSNAANSTGFADKKAEKLSLTGQVAATEPTEKTDPALKEALDKQLRGLRGGR